MATITEDYVSFQTAELLKEKGMDKSCFKHYVQKNNNDGTSEAVTVCTLQMAMKWLREVHNLVIRIELIDYLEHGEVWFYSVLERKTIKQIIGEDFTEHSYEQACEAAIKYCLENLI